MSTRTTPRTAPRRQRGFTLVELMVTVAIALFLLGGLVTIVQNMRGTYLNQQSLVQLQDQQRFALTVLTDAIQAAGFVGDPTTQSSATFGTGAPFQTGWVFAGTHTAGIADAAANDTVSVRFQSDANAYGPVLCNGTDISQQVANIYSIQFGVDTVKHYLTCSVAVGLGAPFGAAIPVVGGVQALAVYYGVKRNTAVVDYNVDTYETWNVLQASATDWANVNSVRMVITFFNPLFGQPSQPQFITIERVVEVMARGGMHT